MIPVVAVVGYSNAGKTTLMEKIIAELTQRGHQVGSIKHHHRDFEFDHPGKDTWRHAMAGARTVMLVSPFQMAKVTRTSQEVTLEMAIQEMKGVDIVLVEGFKHASVPKIEVFRSRVHSSLITPPEELIAVAADREFPGLKSYALDDASGLATLIEQEFLKRS